MNRIATIVLVTCLVTCLVPGTLPAAEAADAIRRFVLVAGANDGGTDRATLKFAMTDAGRFVDVMEKLGGVEPGDTTILRQPKGGEIEAALESLRARVVAARRQASGVPTRTELFFYYSGHADDQGLLIGHDRLSYVTLRERMELVPADVRIAVLDACASGAITRIKGGKLKSPFTVDASSNMRGQAFLTSSSATEAAQESERIGGSFFTHYLVSGLRGAADMSSDRKVTLSEAYQFAFNETLNRTVGTRGGAQHPTYDMNLYGTGDVVLTDLRQTTSGFVIPEGVEGRFFVRDEKKRLVLEFYKAAGRTIEIGLEPGTYEIHYERPRRSAGGSVEVREGARVPLDVTQFVSSSPEPTQSRGNAPNWTLDGRHRLEFGVGMSNTASGFGTGVTVTTAPLVHDVASVTASGFFEYQRYVREDLAVGIGTHVLASVRDEGAWSASAVRTVGSIPVSVRWNPIDRHLSSRTFEPFLGARVGPVFVSEVVSTAAGFGYSESVAVNWTAGAFLGGGLDVRIARSWGLGVAGGYNWTGHVGIGDQRASYNGGELTFSLIWLIGKGRSPVQ